jgi:alkyldihydroxyacetonephosphate synthase
MAARLLGGALLLLVFEGVAEATRDGVTRARRIVQRARGSWIGEAPARRWLERRYSVSFRQSGVFARGAFVDTMEVSAPWSRLQGVYDSVRRALGERAFVMAHFSHAYPDGCCIYFSFAGVADPGQARTAGWDEASAATYDAAWSAALDAAVHAGAAISHHHGIGRSKAQWLGAEIGDGVDVLRGVMRAFDPARILNRGALVEASEAGDARAPAWAPDPTCAPDALDRESLLVSVAGARRLGAVEVDLRSQGFSLDFDPPHDLDATVATWIAQGAPGVRDAWLDPADHWLAGLDAMVARGRRLRVPPAPRRAVGPDLTALFVGTGERFGHVERAWLRVHPLGVRRPRTTAFAWDRDPPLAGGEKDVFEDVVREVTR